MSLVYPTLSRSSLPTMLRYAVMGALIAGLYGVAHDQVTYSISPEYFTRLKFQQFEYANFGFPPRFFVAEIGFLATWWVGFIAGWFLARVEVPAFPPPTARSQILRGFAIILACGCSAGLVGFGLGLLQSPNADLSGWEEFASQHGVVDLRNFVRVAYIHNGGYLGSFIGLILALGNLWRLKRRAGKVSCQLR